MTLLFLLVVVLVMMAAVTGLIGFRQQILASRPLRVGLAILTVPVILFCGFGFLASFEGSDAGFVAFRVGYAVVAVLLGATAAFLAFGRIRSTGRNGLG
jgi:hypothetical protein